MASPITHIILADKIFDEHFSGKDRKDFFVGTSLPDIRYLDNIDRDQTHLMKISLDEIKNENSFLAGFKFHSLLDLVWNDFYVHHPDFPFYFEPDKITAVSFKFLEDELFYDRLGEEKWKEIIGYMDGRISGGLDFEIPEADLKKWYGALKKYFSRKPDDESRTEIIDISEGSIHGPELAQEVNRFIGEMRQNQKLLAAADGFYQKFGELIKKT